MLALLVAIALAQSAEPTPADPPHKLKWKGYVLPVAGGNSTDGFGFGAGGEIFARPPEMDFGYTFKASVLTWWTIPLNYTSQYLQFEWRGTKNRAVLRAQYQGWSHLPYAGAGGVDVAQDRGPDEDAGRAFGPYFLGGLSRPILGSSSLRAYVQGYVHPLWTFPDDGSLLDTRQPLGARGKPSAGYGDVTIGVLNEDIDRWPMPTSGGRAEVDVRLGGTVDGDLAPLVGLHGEVIRWFPLAGERMVLGGRLLVEKSFGHRPYYEQFITAGYYRDEIGLEQAMAGYGRIRPRGDGIVAAMVEARPKLFGVGKKIRLDVYASAFAEAAWLFDRGDPGPFMPTVGIGPDILFQGGSQLRPWLGWGWVADEPGGPRHPSLQFGLSTVDPL